METARVRISFRVTPDAAALLKALARAMGISQTAVVEVLVREKAQQLGVSVPR